MNKIDQKLRRAGCDWKFSLRVTGMMSCNLSNAPETPGASVWEADDRAERRQG